MIPGLVLYNLTPFNMFYHYLDTMAAVRRYKKTHPHVADNSDNSYYCTLPTNHAPRSSLQAHKADSTLKDMEGHCVATSSMKWQ